MTTGKTIGYKRVSAADQREDRQLEGLTLDKEFVDKASGKSTERPQLQAMLEYVREGDTVLVHSIDRLARNLEDLIRLAKTILGRGAAIRFTQEGLCLKPGTQDPTSQLILSVMGAVAEFERAIIRERQREGITLAKARGVYKGGRPALSEEKLNEAIKRMEAGVTMRRVAKDLKISRTTLWQLKKRGMAD